MTVLPTDLFSCVPARRGDFGGEAHGGQPQSRARRRVFLVALGIAGFLLALVNPRFVPWPVAGIPECHAVIETIGALLGLLAGLAITIVALRRVGAEHKRAKDALQHAVQQWRTTFQSLRDPLFIADVNGTIVRCNREFAALLGKDESDIVGGRCHELVHGLPNCIDGCPLVAARASGRRERTELKAGDLWYEVAVDPILDDSAKVSGIVHVMNDITQSKQARAELSRNCEAQKALNELLRLPLENTPVEEVLHRSLDLVLSIPWLAIEPKGSIFLAEDDPPMLVMKAQRGLPSAVTIACATVPFGRCLCGRAALTQQPQFAHPVDDRHETRCEGLVPHGHYCIPIVSGGRTLGVLDLYTEAGRRTNPTETDFLRTFADGLAGIIERKRAQAALRTSEKRFRTLFTVSRDAIMTLAPPAWRFTSANPATVELFQCESEADFVSMAPWQLSPERQPDGELSSTKAVRMIETAMKIGSHFFEWTHQRKDGEAFPATVLLTRVELDDTVFLQATVRDVTEARLAEEKLRKKEEELRQSQKMEVVGQLAGGIAHEFNNLLQAIGGYTKYAMQGLDPDEQRCQDLQQVAEATDRAAGLTRQLLGFSRHRALERRSIDPNQLVRDLAKMAGPLIGEHIELKVILAQDVGNVDGDPAELQQVLLNLCLNARDAMPSGGELILRTENTHLDRRDPTSDPKASAAPHVAITVTDTGCGMTPEVKERIFEPFFTTKEVGKGTGLGLAKVYGVIQQHGGTIHVYSEPGKGTTFRLYLPTAEAAADVASAEERPAPADGTETILVAEDEPMVRHLAARILTEAGYTVLVASDGEEALRVFDENRWTIGLVLLDAVMPKLSGREVFRRIKAESPEVKILFCTGYDPESAHCRDIKEERARLVQKPFDAALLLRTVREVLDVENECPLALATH